MNAADFRARMEALPEPPAGSHPPHWDYWRHDLWWRAQFDEPENFCNWPSIFHTMLVRHFDTRQQLAYLEQDWPRWGGVCTLPPGIAYADEEAQSKNLINQAYHLKLWEDTTGTRVDYLRTILEFGGGYGAMALACRRLGFQGRYLIHDLPEFALLQAWYLGQFGIEVEHVAANQPADALFAIYSLSETPLAERRAWLGQARSYCILYSGMWAGIDNAAWAGQVEQELFDETPVNEWRTVPMLDRPDFYLMGWLE